MAEAPRRVLVIEDNPGDARLIETTLAGARHARFAINRAGSLSEALERLAAGGIDVVLTDLGLPDSEGIDTFLKIQAHVPWLPVVVMSGLEDDEGALLAVQQGAQDYLLKRDVLVDDLLARALVYAIERKRNETELIKRGMGSGSGGNDR